MSDHIDAEQAAAMLTDAFRDGKRPGEKGKETQALDTKRWLNAQHKRIMEHERRQQDMRQAPPEVITRTYLGETVYRRIRE